MKAILVHGALLALIVFIPAHQLLDPQVAAGVSLISALLLIVFCNMRFRRAPPGERPTT